MCTQTLPLGAALPVSVGRSVWTLLLLAGVEMVGGVVVVMPVVAESVSVCALSGDSRAVRVNCPNMSVTLQGA
ncbi:hypothetical protein, partial [Pseudomonas sp. D2002]|uniref:hypothetical protein n=1 Tax=Pseudomonas sp. D2002 TaxID=2726980 RepID=UPI001C431C8E